MCELGLRLFCVICEIVEYFLRLWCAQSDWLKRNEISLANFVKSSALTPLFGRQEEHPASKIE